MIKPKYLLLLFLLIGITLAFRFQSFTGTNESIEKFEIPVEIPVPDYSQEIKAPLVTYDSIVKAEINETGAVGAALVITYKNQIALLECFGVKELGSKDSINKNTIFRLASVSKTVSGVLAGILADEKTINLDDKVVKYLPNLKLQNAESTNQLSIRHLLSHTSGLIPHSYDLMVEDMVPLDKITERLNEVDITAPPGQVYGYQNVMFSLFDPVLKRRTNKSFGKLVQEKVFKPFGMNDASTGFAAFKKNNNKAFPHYGGDNNFRTLKLNNRYYSTAPAAGVNASIADLGNFLIQLTDKDSYVFSKTAKQLVFTPQIVSPLKRSYFRNWHRVSSKQYALGWRIVDYKGRKVAYHGGFVSGYRAEIAHCMEEEIGIAFLTNAPNSMVSKTVPTFLDLLFEFRDKQQQLKTTAP